MDASTWISKNCRFAQQVSLDDSPLRELIQKNINDVRAAAEKTLELSRKPIDQAAYVNAIKQVLAGLPPPIQSVLGPPCQNIMSLIGTNPARASDAASELIASLVSPAYQKAMQASWSSVRSLYKILIDMDEHLSAATRQHQSTDEQVAEYSKELETEYGKAMQQMADVREKLVSYSKAVGTNAWFVVKPDFATTELGSKILYPINLDIDITFGKERQFETPNFSLWPMENEQGEILGYEVENVLEWADTDFFENDDERKFYFGLVDFFRTGQLPAQKGKNFIKLYRGMSTDEYVKWERGDIIPKGKFFTSTPTTQFAEDIPGKFPELFSFSVRDDAVAQTSPGTYQIITDSRLDGKKIVPVNVVSAWLGWNCRFAQTSNIVDGLDLSSYQSFLDSLKTIPREQVAKLQAEMDAISKASFAPAPGW
jgi:hypothetical protein